MRVTPLLLGAAALVLTACSGGPLPEIPGVGPAEPTAQVQEGPAPSATKEQLAVRVDQATRVGDDVALGITVATAWDEARLYVHEVEVVTNTGVRIQHVRADADTRTIPKNSVATTVLSVPLPDPGVTELTVQVNGSGGPVVKVPVPEEGDALVWRPAPLRQVGLAPEPVRTQRSELVLDAIRSEGLITEVEFHATGLNGGTLAACAFRDGCLLTGPGGIAFPAIAESGAPRTKQDVRARGTVRFLGELPPDATELTLAIDVEGGTKGQDQRVTLPTHDDSPAVPAAGDLTRPEAAIDPVTLTDPESGATVVIDTLDVLSDHIQMHVKATGGTKRFDMSQSPDSYDGSALIEPGGFRHTLQRPADADLIVPPGGTLDATLVFQGSVPADVTQLTLDLGNRYTVAPALTTQLTIPKADKAEPAASDMLGQVGAPASEEPAPRVTPSVPQPTSTASPAPRATAAALDVANIAELPLTEHATLGVVRTAIAGVTPQGQKASSENVDAQAEAEAQRTLQDLGAQRTPDGWVLTLPETVLFDYNEATVKADAATELEEVAKLLTHFDQAKIGVQGHTDSTGTAEHNQDLSQRRAQAVADALAGQGITASRMTVEGFGFDRPIASNSTDEGKAKNRRVEIVLRENA